MLHIHGRLCIANPSSMIDNFFRPSRCNFNKLLTYQTFGLDRCNGILLDFYVQVDVNLHISPVVIQNDPLYSSYFHPGNND